MTSRLLAWITTAVCTAIVLCGGLTGALLTGTGAAARCAAPPTDPDPNMAAPAATPTSAPASGYDSEQLTNAATIVSVGTGRRIPERGLIIAVATALQESTLRNLGHLGTRNDHDSIGLFQQRPSQGWGNPDQIMDPMYASNTFYDKLLTIPSWEQLPLTEAAQAVQHSAYPDAYAKWEPDATTLVALTLATYGDCTGGDGMSSTGEQLPADYTLPPDTPLPAAIAIQWALQQLGTPYTFGGDCTDPHSGNPAEQCDCSSLVQQAYRAGGISLPRVTDDQQHAGTPVPSPADIRPGDLIFIPGSGGTRSDPGHVGLYIGYRLVIHAPHTGDVVKLTKITAWADKIAGVRRVIKED